MARGGGEQEERRRRERESMIETPLVPKGDVINVFSHFVFGRRAFNCVKIVMAYLPKFHIRTFAEWHGTLTKVIFAIFCLAPTALYSRTCTFKFKMKRTRTCPHSEQISIGLFPYASACIWWLFPFP